MTDRETPQAGDARPDPGAVRRTPPGATPAGPVPPASRAGTTPAPTRARWVRATSLGVATNAPSSFTAGAIDPVRTGTVRAPVRAPSAARPTAGTPAVAAAAPADARAVRDRPARPGRAAKVWATPPLTVTPKPGSPAAARQAGAGGIPAPRGAAGAAGPAGTTSTTTGVPVPGSAAGVPAPRSADAGAGAGAPGTVRPPKTLAKPGGPDAPDVAATTGDRAPGVSRNVSAVKGAGRLGGPGGRTGVPAAGDGPAMDQAVDRTLAVPAPRTVPVPTPTGRSGEAPWAPGVVAAPDTDVDVAADVAADPLLPGSGRGRHRRPRRRRVLFAAGGLALAAGVLSLARMAPESMTGIGGGGGPADAEPRGGTPTAADTDPADDAVTTVEAVPPPARPGVATATAVMGGESADPTAGAGPTPGPSPTASGGAAPAGHAEDPDTGDLDTGGPGATGIPTDTSTTRPPQAPDPAPTAPRHTPTQAPTTRAPAPTHRPGVCVPIVGICVGGPLSRGQQG
ncbi:hypothetical protein [Streptomyces sp. NBC_00687]|uniref:hypothetical protein n=1 Tax=Streptomyces sp. NBC_00687 TaxID=2975807 RepID=UPI002258B023|nr:hypothetical protein [Streptomyces sp. NBC_00687]MCX4916656.1 hypothetical protein [Streptomyces sp. NBC_00687]